MIEPTMLLQSMLVKKAQRDTHAFTCRDGVNPPTFGGNAKGGQAKASGSDAGDGAMIFIGRRSIRARTVEH